MTERERLLSVLGKGKPDRIPWYADLSYLYESMKARSMLDETYKGDEGYLRFYKDLGVGICFYAPFLWETEFTGGVEYLEIEKDDIRTCTYLTPIGEIRSVQKYMQKTYAWAYLEHFVKNIYDLRIMLYVFENTRYADNYEEFRRVDRLWGGNGIPAGLTPVSAAPLQKLLARWAGVETTVDIYMDNNEEFEDIIKAMEMTEDSVFDIICNSDAQYIEFAENLSSEITGRAFFEKYNMPYYKRRIKQIHDAGKFAGIHIDGTLRTCLPLLEKCGFDVAEAVTPYPVGDVRIKELRDIAGKNIVIWGGLPGTIFTPQFTNKEFENFLNEVLETFSHDSGFVLGVGDQVPPDGLISRVKMVRESVEQIE